MPPTDAPRVAATVLTCAGREAVLAQTLANLRRSDWGEEPTVFRDLGAGPDHMGRQKVAARQLLTEALGRPWEYLLFFEDDIDVNDHLRHNLTTWGPLVTRKAQFASLYAPGGMPFVARGPRVAVPDPAYFYGAQGMLLSRACVGHVLAHYEEAEGFIDIRCRYLAAPLGPFFCHAPSLVQHVGFASVWGGGFHQAVDFDRGYRA